MTTYSNHVHSGRQGRRIPESDRTRLEEAARALRAQGRTRAQIAAALGVSVSTVHALVQGEQVRHPGLRARAKDDLRERARALRAQGRTYDEIVEALGVAKSSVSLWTRDVPCGPRKYDPDRVARMREARWAGVLGRRDQVRRGAQSESVASVGRLTDRELLLIGVALYWSEGTKRKPWGRQEVLTFINSDPDMIRIYLRWLGLLEVDTDAIRLTLAIHETADADAATSYWSGITGLPQSHFNATNIKRHKPLTRRHNTGDDYHGCLRIHVCGGSRIYPRVEGWWAGIIRGAGLGGEVSD